VAQRSELQENYLPAAQLLQYQMDANENCPAAPSKHWFVDLFQELERFSITLIKSLTRSRRGVGKVSVQ